MASTYTQTLEQGLTDFKNTGRIVAGLLPRLGFLKYAMPGDLQLNQDTDTWGKEILQSIHNTDIEDYPTPIISRRGQFAQNSVETIITARKVTRQLGFYSEHFKLDKGTKMIKSGNIQGDLLKKLTEMVVCDVAKLAVRTMDDIDSTAGNNIWAGSGTSDTDEAEEIGYDDIAAAYYVLRDADWQPFDEISDLSNNYNITRYPESYVLVVNEDQVTGMLANMIAEQHYILAKDYKTDDPDEVCKMVGIPVKVVKSRWVKKVAGGATTSGMRQTGGVNNVYHAYMMAGESWAFPSLGKKIMVAIDPQAGKQDAKLTYQGISVKMWPSAEANVADPDGIWDGGTIQYWSGDTSDGKGGLLIPRYDDTGTAKYGIVKIHATARSYT